VISSCPGFSDRFTRAAYVLGRVVVAPLDRILGDRENAYVLASTTYVVARKA